MAEGKFSIAQRMKSFTYAYRGLVKVFSVEHNMWIHLAAAICVVVAGFYFDVSASEWILLTMAIGAVITAELFNSAIEKLVDMVSPGFNEKAGLVKDIAAGAVLVCATAALVTGLLIFVPKL